MSRIIKFRAWWKQQKKMDNGLTIEKIGKSYSFPLVWCELMQFTGLLDKNGVEIYEGDIVKTGGIYPGQWHNIEVSFINAHFYPLLNVEEGHNCIDEYHPEDFEVIGNVHQHPELLCQKL